LPELTDAVERAATDQDRRSRPLGVDEKIDPNRAAEEELDRLPGVGPSTARAIVAARDDGVVFRRPEDLMSVRGVGPGLVSRIRGHVEFVSPPRDTRTSRRESAARVDINRAGAKELQSLPGVGPAIAERILIRRRQRRFETVDDLLDVKGVGSATLERLRSRVTVFGGR
jgi:competence protein ComEA